MKNRDKLKSESIEKRLELLIKVWANNSFSLAPKKKVHSSAGIRLTLNALVEAQEKVNDVILEYDAARMDNKELSERYNSNEIYHAGMKCISRLNQRWDRIYTKAKKEGDLDTYQIERTDAELAKVHNWHRERNLPKNLE